MRIRLRSVRVLAGTAVVGSLLTPVLSPAVAAPVTGADDAVVVAVIDSSFNPYHWDFLASKMPQAANQDRGDDLPLATAPHTYLPGFPSPKSFSTYSPLRLSLAEAEADESASPSELDTKDAAAWGSVRPSNSKQVHYRWIPDSKIIGALSFAPEDRARGTMFHAGTNAHGRGTSSVSVGNLFGTCPECLAVLIQYTNQQTGEDAINWAMDQPWIDVITNSYGFSIAERERVYNGSDVDRQRAATDRGQSILFSAGNGISNTFTVPNSTLGSSQEGPDWIITVGATSPDDDEDYTGTGKPADIAGIGTSYPSSYNARDMSGGARFGGTSNATPTIAGTYARALYLARRHMAGRSRIQRDGVISVGAFSCGRRRPDCELGDGRLTERELRARLFLGATATNGRFDPGSQNLASSPVAPADLRYLAEGHGTYRARLRGDEAWLREFNHRLVYPLLGRGRAPRRLADEVDYMRVDSYCRQHIWGSWEGGYYLDGEQTPLPGDDPARPARTAYRHGCEGMTRPPPPPG